MPFATACEHLIVVSDAEGLLLWLDGDAKLRSSPPPALGGMYCCAVPESLRVVIGEDDVLLREGIARLLTEGGFEVAAQAGDADDFLRRALAHRPNVAVVDVQMPPGQGDDGLRAAVELRRQRPDTGVLVLSQFYEEHYAVQLIGERPEGVGYLLKERVGDVDDFVDAVRRVAGGGSALDPGTTEHRRVLAVLAYLRESPAPR